MLKTLAIELKKHAPFTVLGTLTGIVIMLIIILGNFISQVSQVAQNIFYVLHPTHVVLSAITTTAMYRLHTESKIFSAVLIGYVGSIGIATISDSIIPYLGEFLLDLPNKGVHIGFVEKWWIVNPAALLGIIIGYSKGITKFPHYGHVLISTWASLFHVIMALGVTINFIQTAIILIFLFFAVWLPCCGSDIIFPLLFARDKSVHSVEKKHAD
ncbi:MAG: hypothetical protein J7J73_02450 [Deltaproteobacteria bacterium]|nr:hypothetical protein [Deltaproteobacteria bacterium]